MQGFAPQAMDEDAEMLCLGSVASLHGVKDDVKVVLNLWYGNVHRSSKDWVDIREWTAMIRNISSDGPGTQREMMTRDGDCFSSQLRVRGRSLQKASPSRRYQRPKAATAEGRIKGPTLCLGQTHHCNIQLHASANNVRVCAYVSYCKQSTLQAVKLKHRSLPL